MVLIILATISINAVIGEDGIIKRAESARQHQLNAEASDNEALDELEAIIKQNTPFEVSKVTDTTPGELAGKGTEAEPYLIESIEDLIQFSNNVSNGTLYANEYVKITQDLDFNSEKSYVDAKNVELFGDYNGDGEVKGIKEEVIDKNNRGFISIGKMENNTLFSGIFNGNNATIANLYINDKENDSIGLFTGNLGTITNLNLTGNIASTTDDSTVKIGGISGYNRANIENCSTKIIFDINTECEVGGIVGTMDEGIVKNCINNSELQISGHYGWGIFVGGIAGVHNDGVIKNSKNYGKVIATNAGDYLCCGGISGNSLGEINGCINYGDIYAEGGEPWVGGISGDAGSKNKDRCYNLGNIKVVSAPYENGYSCPFVGGVFGYTSGDSISNCYNTGDIEVVDSKIQSEKLWIYLRRILWSI